jgi:hypothetical protein
MAHMATAFGEFLTGLEVIDAFTIAPWHSGTRTAVHITDDREACAK